MGAWSQLFEVFNPALTSLQTFLQAIAVLGAGCFAAYYKIREMFAGPQEDQMYSQKTKGVFLRFIGQIILLFYKS